MHISTDTKTYICTIHICTYTLYLFFKSDNNFWQYFWHYISVVVIGDYLQLLEVRERFIF